MPPPIEEFGRLIGYIVILGFGATIVITLLALVGYLPKVRDKYLGWLFSLVVVELAGAGFWFFNETFKQECPICPEPPEPPRLVLQPPLPESGVYLSGIDGEPVQRTDLVLGGVTEQTINETADIKLDIFRSLELDPDGDHLLVKSQRVSGLQLGRIRPDNLSRNIIDRTMPVDRHLALGQHYADCVDYPECKQRRDAAQAVFHLRWVLEHPAPGRQQSEAAINLFHLQRYLHDCETLMLLAGKINEYRLPEHRYPEVADIYHTIAESTGLRREQRTAAHRLSLKYLLNYLGLNRVNSNTEFFRRVLGQATDLARYLGQGEMTTLLEEIRNGLSPEPENQNYKSLSFYLRNDLLRTGDSIEETFQCPT